MRRAGYAHRAEFERFYHRYKLICPATWPTGASGDAKTECGVILGHLGAAEDTQYVCVCVCVFGESNYMGLFKVYV